ncbi:MAG: outer membrane beta-barrel protein [Bacteroidia bacterium]|nr:outer membrane beta-barrel protein [Bacteroidia bacterium]
MKSISTLSLLSIFFITMCTGTVKAQELSFGIYAGAFNYQGDLVEGLIEIKETQPAFGLFGKYLMFRDLAISGNVFFGKISGDDANSEELSMRGLSFESNLVEGAVTLEYHPIGQGRFNSRGDFLKSISPYVYAGVGFTFGEPEVTGFSQGAEDLNNTTTTRLGIPFGLGVQWTFNEKLYVALEGGTRMIFDDYLDGVSISGNPDANDWYVTAGLKVGFYLSGEPSMF